MAPYRSSSHDHKSQLEYTLQAWNARGHLSKLASWMSHEHYVQETALFNAARARPGYHCTINQVNPIQAAPEQEQAAFFLHECGRHVGGVPRSSLKERKHCKLMGEAHKNHQHKTTKQTHTNPTPKQPQKPPQRTPNQCGQCFLCTESETGENDELQNV